LWELYAAAFHFCFERVGVPVVIHYIDHFLFVVKSKREAQSLLERALELCVELGLSSRSTASLIDAELHSRGDHCTYTQYSRMGEKQQ
jgi:hypothetical protein